MKQLKLRSAVISALFTYVLGVSAFVISYFVPVLEDPDRQANLVLMTAMIPAASLGAYLYYRRGHETNGILLGAFLFLLTIFLDALITVPLFIIPGGGNHASFFADPGFWMIGLEYIVVVAAYRQINKILNVKRVSAV